MKVHVYSLLPVLDPENKLVCLEKEHEAHEIKPETKGSSTGCQTLWQDEKCSHVFRLLFLFLINLLDEHSDTFTVFFCVCLFWACGQNL